MAVPCWSLMALLVELVERNGRHETRDMKKLKKLWTGSNLSVAIRTVKMATCGMLVNVHRGPKRLLRTHSFSAPVQPQPRPAMSVTSNTYLRLFRLGKPRKDLIPDLSTLLRPDLRC